MTEQSDDKTLKSKKEVDDDSLTSEKEKNFMGNVQNTFEQTQFRDFFEKLSLKETPLKEGIRAVRKHINEGLQSSLNTKDQYHERLNQISSTAFDHTLMTLERVGINIDRVNSFQELCFKHPNLVAAVPIVAISLPSLIFGKSVALRNAFYVGSSTYVGLYFMNKSSGRIKK